jgi:Met-zincin/Domain of unknown function (DUF5117)/Domain of unknown function (DUF5118)
MIRSVLAAWLSLVLVVGGALTSPGGPAQAQDKPGPQQKPDEPKKEEPKKEEPKKEEPKKEEPKKPETPASAPSSPRGGAFRKAATKESKVKPYDEIVTAEHKSDNGLFMVHRLDEKILYEIPADALGKEMLWVTQIEKTGAGMGYGGSPAGDRVIRWEQRGDDILLRDVTFDIRADTKDPIKDAVQSSSVEPIIAVLPVKAYGKDKAPVIDVTELFVNDTPEFGVGRRLGASGNDSRKTFIEQVKSFPENIESKITMTFRRGGGISFGPGGPTPSPRGMGGGGPGGNVTVLVHHSMIKLPEEPMKPRKSDDRVGFFTESFQDYGDVKNHQVENVKYITRWRLEKKDPSADVSEPKKPIVFYLGREVPDRYRAAIKKGIEAWQPAFEKAGFKKAIIAKDAPNFREDPDWDAEDARYSTIRWLPATIENAMGPHVHDPRTGEILEADILMYHNILKLTRDWYFVQASPNDPRAQSLPMPDDLIGELLTYVVAHEVGHTLGFPHNMKGSSSYTIAQLRDPKFTAENGTEASIMDYGRFNYVAQPGDNAALIPVIGPYDKFAVEWGYKTFPEARTFEQEKAKLDEIASRQIKDATLRFGDPNGVDPSSQTEDLGSDAVAATDLGLKNLDRVAAFLVKATVKKGDDYSLLQNMYEQLVAQRNRELNHVISTVGGTVETNLWFGDADRRFNPVPGDKQKEAIAFLNARAFQTPASLILPDVIDRLEANGVADRILQAQTSLLRNLISDNRSKRMAEQVARDPKGAYSPLSMLADLRNGIWSELKGDPVDIDLYRRNLQRAHLDLLTAEVARDVPSSDLPALTRSELQTLGDEIASTLSQKKVSPSAQIHLQDLKFKIAQALMPKSVVPSSSPTNPGRIILGGDVEEPLEQN